jgi:DNA-binding Lrp family transcriptional regulator
MGKMHKKRTSKERGVADIVRSRIVAGGERIWRFSDFEGLSFTAVAQALSRLAKEGVIQRVGKGLYYRSKQTLFGPSQLNTSQLRSLPIHRKKAFPAGNAAANFLGFSTQNAATPEIATNGLSLPRLLVGNDTIIHTRRPEAWKNLSYEEAALLDFLRQGGKASELSPIETVQKVLKYFQEDERFKHVVKVAESEPPRVRALLGAIGQQIGHPERYLSFLRKSLNPLSKFDFGNLFPLKYAKQWQARESKTYETFRTS